MVKHRANGQRGSGRQKISFALPFCLNNVPRMNSSEDLAIEEARRAGFDMNLIDLNLSLSPEERWRQHDMVLEIVFELQNARVARDAKLQSTPPATR